MVDTTAREIETAAAEANPNILSSLSGASSPVPAGVPPQAQQAAQDVSSQLFGGGLVSSGETGAEAARQELFNLDQQLEQNYSPFPQVPGFVDNPADAYGAASTYATGVGQVGQQIGGAVSDAERAYNAAISNVLDKFLGFYELQESKKEAQAERDYREKQDRLDFDLQMAKLTGGSITNPYTGEKITIPTGEKGTATERLRAQTLDQVKRDVAEGVTIEDLISRYAGTVDYADLISIYNAGSRYGPAQRGEELYRGLYEKVGEEPEEAAASEGKQTILNSINDLLAKKTDPITGFMQIQSRIPGSAAQSTVANFEQLQGLLSLKNREQLKGSGSISDFEAELLQQAASRLSRKMSDKDFRAELERLRAELGGGGGGGGIMETLSGGNNDPLGIR